MSKRKKVIRGNMEELFSDDKIRQAFVFHVLSALTLDYTQVDCSDYEEKLFESIIETCAEHILSRFADVDYLDVTEEYTCMVGKGTGSSLNVTCLLEVSDEDNFIDWGSVQCNQALHRYSTIIADTLKKLIDSITYAMCSRRFPLEVEVRYTLQGENEKLNKTIEYLFERIVGDVDTFPTLSEGFGGASKEVIQERCDLIACEVFNKGVLSDCIIDKIVALNIPDTLLIMYDDERTKDKEAFERDSAYLDFYLRALQSFTEYVLCYIYGSDNKLMTTCLYSELDNENTADDWGWEVHATMRGANMPYKEEVLDRLKTSGIMALLPAFVLYDSEKDFKAVVARANN